jgi:hypothetical protein
MPTVMPVFTRVVLPVTRVHDGVRQNLQVKESRPRSPKGTTHVGDAH